MPLILLFLNDKLGEHTFSSSLHYNVKAIAKKTSLKKKSTIKLKYFVLKVKVTLLCTHLSKGAPYTQFGPSILKLSTIT